MEKKFNFPDTGQIKCYNEEGKEKNYIKKEKLYGQNGNFIVNPIKLIKLGENCDKISESKNWEDGLRIIKDENTGLIWEVKSPIEEDINYCQDKYSFDEINEKYIKKLNSEKYGGRSDWRMPNKDELRSIVDYSKINPSIDTSFFENTIPGFYWCENVYEMQDYFGWVISFGMGAATANSKSTKRFVRAVCGGNDKMFGKCDASRFIDNKDETITDTTTGLMWQKGENERMSWYKSLETAQNMDLAGYTDWRMPNIKELNTILNLNYDNNWWYYKDQFPAIGLEPPLLHYFSSTTYNNTYAWVTNFCFGYDGYYAGKNAPLLFRAVRNIEIPVIESNEFKISDHGQRKLYDDMGNNFEKIEENEEFYGQAGNYKINPKKYKKLGERGKEVSEESKVEMIEDENSGLIWERKSSKKGDFNYSNKKYTFAEAKNFIEEMNEENYGGFGDWRFPNKEELRTIVTYGEEEFAIDMDCFPNTKNEFYWSKDVYKSDDKLIWGVYFGYGCTIAYLNTLKFPMRAVRGGHNKNYGDMYNYSFVDNGDGTVTDKNSKLMWKQEESPEVNWKEALKYCEELNLGGHNDWRLPSMKELGMLIDTSFANNNWYYEEVFPDTKSKPLGFYSSSNTFAETFVWGINFTFGYDGYYGNKKDGKYPFRPVRNV